MLLRRAIAITYRADHGGFVRAAGLQLFGSLSPSVLVVIGKLFLDSLASNSGHRGHHNTGTILVTVAALSLVTGATLAATNVQQQQQRILGERAASEAWRDVLRKTATLPYDFFESPELFDRLQRIKTGAFSQQVAVTTAMFGMLGAFSGLFGLVAVLLALDPILVPILLAAGLPSLLLSRRIAAAEGSFLESGTPIFRGRDYLRTVLTGRVEAKEVKTFNAHALLTRRHEEWTSKYDRILSRHAGRRARLALLDALFTSLVLFAAVALLVRTVLSGQLSIGSAAGAILAVRFVSVGLSQLFQSLGRLYESSMFLAELEAFLTLPSEAAAEQAAPAAAIRRRPMPTARAAGQDDAGLRVENVSFAYPRAQRPALHRVSIGIEPGEIVAIVGQNGSGKSTLAKIVAGLYRPDSGRVLWRGADVAELDPDSYRAHVSALFQDFVRYQLSALDNVGIGEPARAEDATAAERSARQAGVLDRLQRLPNGFDTLLSREFGGGVDLSGGEWQRVALARALRKPSSLIVLDEPTAALDPGAEAEFLVRFRHILENRATLLVSHRFNSVRLADRIYVLEEGRVIESGTHEELIRAAGVYAGMFAAQAEAYE